MPSTTETQRAMQVFPQLYLAVPPFRRFKIMIEGKQGFLRPVACDLLWLIGALADRANRDWCLEKEFRNAVRRYTDSNITRAIQELIDAGCITNPRDTRGKVFQLESEGKKVVEVLRSEKETLAKALLNRFSDENRPLLLQYLEEMALAAVKPSSQRRRIPSSDYE